MAQRRRNDFVALNHLKKWEASCQECQPIALGPLGTLDGILRLKRITIPSALDPLGSLAPSGLPICQPSQVIPK
jgi:hypothetical protein